TTCSRRRTKRGGGEAKMSKKAAQSSKKPAPTNAPERSSEQRSPIKPTTPPLQVKGKPGPEHELESDAKAEAQASNDGTRLVTGSERPMEDHSRSETGPAGSQNREFVRNAPPFVRYD